MKATIFNIVYLPSISDGFTPGFNWLAAAKKVVDS